MFVFDTDTQIEPTEPGRYRSTITDRWNIGTNPNGGYLLAIAARAMAAAVPQHSDPFTVSAHYLRPGETGDALVDVDVVRTGRKMSNVRATLHQGKPKLELLGAFGNLSEATGPTAVSGAAPSIPPPEQCVPRLPTNADRLTMSEMAHRTETRLDPVTGWINGKPSGTALVNGWTRFSDGRDADALSLLFFADSFPPAVFEVLSDGAGWVPTIELTVHVRRRPAPGWLQVRMQTRYLMDGYFEEDGEIWDSTGKLVCQSRQFGMIFRP